MSATSMNSCGFCTSSNLENVKFDDNSWYFAVPNHPIRRNGRHIQVVSNSHVERFDLLNGKDGANLVSFANVVGQFFNDRFKSDQYFMCIRNGESAGQKVKHLHVDFISVKPEEVTNENIERLHNELATVRDAKSLSSDESNEIIKQFQRIFENVKNINSQVEDNIISGKTQLVQSKYWTLVLKTTPSREGHIVAVSNKKRKTLGDIPTEQGEELIVISKFIQALFESLYGTGENLMYLRNGEAAGQRLPCVHVHFVPGLGKKDGEDIVELHEGLTKSRVGPSLSGDEISTSMEKFRAKVEILIEKDEFKNKKISINAK
ncbi:MAG: hypothetical protein K1000chlam3_00879 [Chlamydiae bacterium]|nr:hypothetical protein [Chlamydiota bacterium]